MTDYTLTIESEPSGVEIKVNTQWIVTNKTLTFTDITEVEVIAPQTVGELTGSTDKGWRFVKWEDGSTNPKRTVDITGNPTITATYELQEYYPVRHHLRRKEKYEAKTDEEVYASRTLNLKQMMIEQTQITTAQQERLEKLVGEYLNKQNLYGAQIHHYRNYSQALYRLKRTFQNQALTNEATLEAKKWQNRGLNPTHLQNIAKLLGINITL